MLTVFKHFLEQRIWRAQWNVFSSGKTSFIISISLFPITPAQAVWGKAVKCSGIILLPQSYPAPAFRGGSFFSPSSLYFILFILSSGTLPWTFHWTFACHSKTHAHFLRFQSGVSSLEPASTFLDKICLLQGSLPQHFPFVWKGGRLCGQHWGVCYMCCSWSFLTLLSGRIPHVHTSGSSLPAHCADPRLVGCCYLVSAWAWKCDWIEG